MSRFVLSAFGDEISPHLDEQIQVLKTHGIAYLECRSVEGRNIIDHSAAEARQISRRLADGGLGVSAVGSPIGKIPIGESFAPHLDRFKSTVEIAHALETTYIRMFSFYMPPGEAPARYRDQVLARWAQLIDAARGAGLILLHENEKGIYGDTAARCLDLLESLSCPYLKAVFDPANFVQCDEQTYPHAFELLKKHIAYLHIKDARNADHSVTPAGQGDGRVPEILQALDQAGFEGFLSIEPHLDNSLPGGGAERFAVAAGALKSILGQIGDQHG